MEKDRLTLLEAVSLFVLVFVQLLTVFKSGTLTDYGLSFWGPHGHDAVFHLALIGQFIREPFSLANPLLAGSQLQNYHLLTDYLLATLSHLTTISPLDWYFRLFPAIVSLSIGVLTLKLLRRWGYSLTSRLIALFLVYAAGSLGHLVNLVMSGSFIGGESRFWSTQAISVLINPPLALSLVGLLLWALLLERFEKKPDWRLGAGLVLLVGLMFETKAYAGVLAGAGLVVATLWQAVTVRDLRRIVPWVWLSFATGLMIGGNILLLTRGGQSLFVFAPLSLVKSMLASPDRLDLNRWSEAWDNYLNGGKLVRLAVLQLVALVLFVVGNFGVRLVAFAKPDSTDMTRKALVSMAVLGILAPIFFVQQGTAWNTVQFLYYSLFITALLSAPVWAGWLMASRNLVQFGGVLLVLGFLSLPTTLGTLKDYLSPVPASVVPWAELRALSFVNAKPGTVLSPLYEKAEGRKFTEPKPLSGYDSTAYLSAVGGSKGVLEDEVNLSIMAYDVNETKKDVLRFYATDDPGFITEFSTHYRPGWIFTRPGREPRENLSALGYSNIFDAGSVKLYTQNQ